MNLEKLENPVKLELCRKYFFGGIFALPFLWVVNVIWFAKEAFCKPPYEEQPKIRMYVIRSMIGALVWIAAIIAWNVIYQLNRASWGEFADQITFIIPQGIP